MKKVAVEPNTLNFSEDNGVITIMAGDTDFQKTLTEVEKKYIHNGMNWISKLGRETELKSLHNFGYTLDQVYALPKEEQEKVWRDANKAWNEKF